MADLAGVLPGETELDIQHPGTKQPTGLKWRLMSINDERMKRVKRMITDRRLDLEKKGKTFKAEEIEDNLNMILFKGSLGWTWGEDADGDKATFNGEQPEFNQKNVIAVLTALPWIADQLQEAINDDERFFINSKPI